MLYRQELSNSEGSLNLVIGETISALLGFGLNDEKGKHKRVPVNSERATPDILGIV